MYLARKHNNVFCIITETIKSIPWFLYKVMQCTWTDVVFISLFVVLFHTVFATVGPSTWKNNYPDCGEKIQSPIDLSPTNSVDQEIDLESLFELSGYHNVRGKCIMKNDGLHGKFNVKLSCRFLY